MYSRVVKRRIALVKKMDMYSKTVYTVLLIKEKRTWKH
tara:strand:+ start:559 stop:672 length:114 start_codon:yes stop_codon:yes gene_type:complete